MYVHLQEAILYQILQRWTREYLCSSMTSGYSLWFLVRCQSSLDSQSAAYGNK